MSTAYCQCNESVLEERGYRAPHSPLGIAQMTQLLDDETLEYLTPRYNEPKSHEIYWLVCKQNNFFVFLDY